MDLAQYSDYADMKDFPKRRRRLSVLETKLLSEVFTYNQKPNAQVRKELGQKLNMTPRAVQIWFQNKRAKVKKGNFSPLMDDHDPGNLFTPSKTEKYQGFTPTTLPTPPGSVFLRPSNSFGASEDSNENLSGYPDITSNFGFWNRNSNDGNLPTGPLSFVGPRSEIIRKRPLFLVDFFNNQAQSLDDHSLLSSIKSSNLEEQFYLKAESSSKDESLVVNFLHPMNPGVRSQTPDLLNGSSNFEAYNIFRDSPDRNLFQP